MYVVTDVGKRCCDRSTGLFDEFASGEPGCTSNGSTFGKEEKRQLLYITGCTGCGSALCCIVTISMVLGLRLLLL